MPRVRGGMVSMASDEPMPHSPPMATPKQARRTRKTSKASSVQPRKAAMTALRCFVVKLFNSCRMLVAAMVPLLFVPDSAEHANLTSHLGAKLPQGFKGIYAALRRLSACDKSQVDCRFIHNRAEVPRASPRSSAASAVTPRLPRTNSLSRALVHPIFRAKAACVIFPG